MSVLTVDLKNAARRARPAVRGDGRLRHEPGPACDGPEEQGTVVFIADDEASAETVLQDADIQYTMRPCLARPRSASSPTPGGCRSKR